MRYFCKHITCLALWVLTAMGPAHLRAAEPILARLSFWVDPERKGEFEEAYEEKVVPFLAARGLVESARRGRATVDSVFSRLFELEELTDIAREKVTLESDPEWQGMLRDLGESFSGSGEALRAYWGAYKVPAGPGTAVVANRPSGVWRPLEIDGDRHQEIARAIVQDREGYLWFSTNGVGAIRYDGLETSYLTPDEGLADPIVTSICQARDGAMWFGTLEGVSRCVEWECVTYTTADGLADNRISAISQQRNGDVWVGTKGGGASRYGGGEWTTFTGEDGLAGNKVWSIAEDGEGVLWFGTYGGVSRYDGNEWKTLTVEDGLAHNKVRSVIEDRQGRLWFGTYGGVSRYDGDEWRTFTTDDGLAHNKVRSVFEDREGEFWFGTEGGVTRYDGDEWWTFTSEDGLVNDRVHTILQDDEGSYWFGTDQGACWYGGQTIVRYTTETGLPHNTVSGFLQSPEGGFWVATDGGGLSRYDGTTWTTFTVEDGLPENRILGPCRDREGNLWFGTGGVGGEEGLFTVGGSGVVRYDGETFTTFTTEDGLVGNWVWWIKEDREGNLWFSSNRGLSRYDGRSFDSYTMEDGLPHDTVGSFYEASSGDLWFGSFGGAIRYDGVRFETLTTEDGLPSDWVLSILEDPEGILWFTSVGPTGGVTQYDGQDWRTYTTEDGVASSFVYRVFMDREGGMWFGTNAGVNRYDGKVFQSLNARDGLTNRHNTGVTQDEDGDLWFVSNISGMTRHRPPAPSPPGIVIDEVVADRSYERPADLSFPSTTVKATFAFHGMSFKTRPGGMVYRYRLKGYDEDWRNTRERLIEYQDLPMGDYTFEVLAVDRDMAYSPKPATVTLRVHPPYDRIGLISALAVALILAGWQTARVVRRGRELRNSNDALSDANNELFGVNRELQQKTDDLEGTNQDLERARMAAESANHAKSLFLANMSHEIRTPMNAILGYAQILQRSDDLNSRHRHAIQTIHQSGYHLLNLINDVLDISKIEAGRMELTPADFDLGELVEGLSVMFELQCHEKGLGWRLEGMDGERLPVHGDEAKVRQVLINLIGNGAKFTTEGEVVLRLLRPREDCYRFEVADTGPGMGEEDLDALFQPFQQGASGMRQGGTGLGLTISQRQLGLMGSELEVESTVGEGSCFSFEVVLPPALGEVETEGVESWSHVTGLASESQVHALVADDVAENREILSSMLSGIGVEVEVVEDGRQALEQMEASLPDVVFLDIRMPVLDGLETLELVQGDDRWSQVKVVAVSASVLDHERAGFLEAGFDDFLDKPFRFEDVCRCLARHLGVVFEYGGEEEGGVPAGEGVDWQDVSLPSALRSGLVKAAEFYSVTEVEEYLREMEDLGEGQRRLASHLRKLRRQHDMAGIAELLGSMVHE